MMFTSTGGISLPGAASLTSKVTFTTSARGSYSSTASLTSEYIIGIATGMGLSTNFCGRPKPRYSGQVPCRVERMIAIFCKTERTVSVSLSCTAPMSAAVTL